MKENSSILIRDIKDIFDSCHVKDISQNNPYHFGMLSEHTAAVVKAALDVEASDAVYTAAMFHDIGKPEAAKVNPKTGYDQYLGHADVSAQMFKKIMEDPKQKSEYKPEFIDYVAELIRLHDTQYSKAGKINNLLETHPEGFADDLITLQAADIWGQSELQQVEHLKGVHDYGVKLGVSEDTLAIVEDFIEAAEHRDLPDQNKEFLARTANGISVYLDYGTKEYTATHTEVELTHIREAVGKMNFTPNEDGSFCEVRESIDLGKVTGHDPLIEISPENQDCVKTLYRLCQDNPSNVIIGEAPETTKLMVAIGQIPDVGIMLLRANPGELTPPESDKEFWKTHALICTEDQIDWKRSNSIEQTQGQNTRSTHDFEEER